MQRVQGPVAPLFDICPKLGGLGKQIFDLKSVHLTKILLVISSLYYIVSQALGLGRPNEKSKTIFTKLRGKKPEVPQRNTVIGNTILPLNIVFRIFCDFLSDPVKVRP